MRIMLDTNVLISVIIFPNDRMNSLIYKAVLDHQLVLSSYIIDELLDVNDIRAKERVAKNNTSGVTGVSFTKRRNKWKASIMLKGKTIHLGTFERIEDAIEARKNAEKEYYEPIIEKWESKM